MTSPGCEISSDHLRGHQGGWPARIGRGLTQPLTWLLLTIVVRLGFLLLLPLQSGLFLERTPAASQLSRPKHSLAAMAAFLQRRTELHPLTVDEHCYDEMAQNILAGRGFVLDSFWVVNTQGQPTTYAGCGYPLFVALVYLFGGNGRELPVYLVQILLQGLAGWFVFRTAARVAGRWAGAAAAAFFCFHPVLIWLSVAMMSEAILVPAVAAMGWLLMDRRALSQTRFGGLARPLALGCLLAVACLTRSTCFGFWVVAACALIWEARKPVSPRMGSVGSGRGRPVPALSVGTGRPHPGSRKAGRCGSWRQRLVPAVWMSLALVLICAPWTIRNYVHWHRWIPFSTKSGVNAYFFNHNGLSVELGPRAVDAPQPIDIYDPRIQRLPDEAARDERLMEMFKEFVREHPAKFIGLCGMRFLMAALPMRITSTSASAAVSAWYAKGIVLALLVPTLVWALARRLRWRRRLLRAWPLLLLVIYWQGIQTLAGPGLRYRLPVEPIWAVWVGAMVSFWLSRLANRPGARSPAGPA